MSKPSADELKSSIKENLKSIISVRSTLTEESDRGCALVSASYIDAKLGTLIEKNLIDNKTHVKKMMDFNGPFGTFSNKINYVYAVGMVSIETYRDLNAIRGIRNEFGHSFDPIDFNNQSISDRCRMLYHSRYDNSDLSISPRLIFISAVMGVMSFIDTKIQLSENPVVPEFNLDLDEIRAMNRFLIRINEVSIDRIRESGLKFRNIDEQKMIVNENSLEILEEDEYKNSKYYENAKRILTTLKEAQESK